MADNPIANIYSAFHRVTGEYLKGDPNMTIDADQIKNGDRVRVTIEGTVKRTLDADNEIIVEYQFGNRTYNYYFNAATIVSVEPSIPTEPDVAMLKVGVAFFFRNPRDKVWARVSDGTKFTWGELWELARVNRILIHPIDIGDPIV